MVKCVFREVYSLNIIGVYGWLVAGVSEVTDVNVHIQVNVCQFGGLWC